ncbi:nucleotidyl transferase AbiEii/AbiGii toxin family protein [Pseudidiomarina sp. 1APP75-27a]|uniref:nucleotidyl transferase AbiEii/AbiGii toxin family protein n=1 Tax=Pseudidiomarina terrestris TaxID=2820060 RepID=UPI002B05FAC7|nr:nucleotidyl transferase AbiEii/AbiGii toxin family protein [Pseudidiomarina sp. 1APP75-27a]MEA3588163.1 nucleotidyl transferase AbiEii/AbiGii toxin family protein [Pseudidiomarina sp. 1APP75-27a]
MTQHGLEVLAAEPNKNRGELFSESAAQRGMKPAAVEKDFWVCWALRRIFADDFLKAKLLFKGGTSLSKCYGLIDRFSEDIDLILDWRCLTEQNPYEERSNTQQDKFNKMMDANAITYVADTLLPHLNIVFEGYTLEIKPDQPKSVLLHYPKIFGSDYIKPAIELEFGPMSAMVPKRDYTIVPYCADLVPKSIGSVKTQVSSIQAIKTFWDKVTILHCEAHRPAEKQQQARYSRHYYDLYKMLQSRTKENALQDIKLLTTTFQFKDKFYPQRFANYPKGIRGEVVLLPPEYRQTLLKADYAAMQEMIFGEYPAWEEIVEQLYEFEKELQDYYVKD